MNKFFLPLVFSLLILSYILISACTKVRESAGVNRKVIDEYTVFQNPPLVLPPDYNLLPSEEIIARKKNIDGDEKLSKEILFGLNEETAVNKSDNTSSALDSILEKSGSNKVSKDIRKDFDEAKINYPESLSQLKKVKLIKKPTPDPHQAIARDAVIKGFAQHDRGKLLMACGTGKTYVSLWIKEELSAKRTLVLVPSLSLL